MIRILIIFFISSCSAINYNLSYFQYAIDYYNLKSDRADFENSFSSEYSYLKIEQDNNIAFFILAETKSANNVQLWVGANNEKIYTFKGLIFKTIGLEHDISLLMPEDLLLSNSLASFSGTSNLTNPDLFEVNTLIRIDVKYSKTHPTILVVKKIPDISWKYKGYIEYISKERIYSVQKIHPLAKEMKLTFNYNFS